MSLSLTIKNEALPLITELGGPFFPPAALNLRGWWDLAGDVQRSARRRAPTRVAEQIIGTPVADANSVLLDGATNYIQTDIEEAPSQTIGFVGWSAEDFIGASTRPVFVGNFLSSGVPSGAYVMVVSTPSAAPAALLRFGAAFLESGSPVNRFVNLEVTNLSIPHYFIAKAEEGVGLTLYDMTAGTSASYANVNPRAVRTAAPHRLGYGYSGNHGQLRLSTAHIIDRAVSDADRAALYAAVQYRASRLLTPLTV